MRIVVDTNVWVSGLLWRGLPWDILHLAETGQVELCMAPAMLAELAEVLSDERLKPRWEELGLCLADLVVYAGNLAIVVEIAGGEPIVSADPDDDKFLRCALEAGAVYVVSGDRHLLDLREYEGIPIVSPRDFLAREFPKTLRES